MNVLGVQSIATLLSEPCLSGPLFVNRVLSENTNAVSQPALHLRLPSNLSAPGISGPVSFTH